MLVVFQGYLGNMGFLTDCVEATWASVFDSENCRYFKSEVIDCVDSSYFRYLIGSAKWAFK